MQSHKIKSLDDSLGWKYVLPFAATYVIWPCLSREESSLFQRCSSINIFQHYAIFTIWDCIVITRKKFIISYNEPNHVYSHHPSTKHGKVFFHDGCHLAPCKNSLNPNEIGLVKEYRNKPVWLTPFWHPVTQLPLIWSETGQICKTSQDWVLLKST